MKTYDKLKISPKILL